MLSRVAIVSTPQCGQVRGMATLKDISMRLKSVTNIQKITKSMKMVSAAKYAKAERDLKPARPYGNAAQVFYEQAEVSQDEHKPNHLVLALTSDRGLCGACNSSIVRAIRTLVDGQPAGINTKIIAVGDKARALFQRKHSDHMLMHFNEVGKKPPTFGDAAVIAQELLNSGYEYDHGSMYFNVFKNVVSYETTILPLFNQESITNAPNLNVYDSVDEEVLRSYKEYSLVSLIFYGMKEAATSEQSARMTSMGAASKNAGEMIEKLTLKYNRTRQAVITTELIDIVTGASAL